MKLLQLKKAVIKRVKEIFTSLNFSFGNAMLLTSWKHFATFSKTVGHDSLVTVICTIRGLLVCVCFINISISSH